MATSERGDTITYEIFCTAYRKLQGEDVSKVPSIREIKAELGRGSPNHLLSLRRRYQAEQQQTQLIDSQLSDTYLKASLAEFGRLSAELKKGYEQVIANQQAELKEVQQLLDKEAEGLDIVKQEAQQQQEAARKQQLVLEKKLAAEQALVANCHQRQAALQKALDTLREEKHQAELKAAVAEARTQELEKQLKKEEEQHAKDKQAAAEKPKKR